MLREVEGGGFEMVSLVEPLKMDEDLETSLAEEEIEEEVDMAGLRDQAYSWPRLIAPPIKRSGHVIMDTCHSSGMSVLNITLAV